MAKCKACGLTDEVVRRNRLGYAHPGACYNLLRAMAGDEHAWVANPEPGFVARELRGTHWRTSVRVTR